MCLAGGRCLKGNQLQSNDFVCLCPPCYSGTSCQFNSNSFTFTLDQLFFTDLRSAKQKIIMSVLIIGSLLMYIIALPNNLFALLTFRCRKCLHNSVGYYLYYMCIINQINIGLLVARIIHLSVAITGLQTHPILDNVICKVLSYLLSCSTRMTYWLASLVALERVYTAVFLRQRWLQRPHIARRFIASAFFLILLSGAYELVFVRAFSGMNDDNGTICVIDFPMIHRSMWMLIHQIVSIINSILPVLINIFCTVTIIYVIIEKKMNIRASSKSKVSPFAFIFLLFGFLDTEAMTSIVSATSTDITQESEQAQAMHVINPISNLSEKIVLKAFITRHCMRLI